MEFRFKNLFDINFKKPLRIKVTVKNDYFCINHLESGICIINKSINDLKVNFIVDFNYLYHRCVETKDVDLPLKLVNIKRNLESIISR